MVVGELGPLLEKGASLAQLILLLGQFITAYFISIGPQGFAQLGNAVWTNISRKAIEDGNKPMVV